MDDSRMRLIVDCSKLNYILLHCGRRQDFAYSQLVHDSWCSRFSGSPLSPDFIHGKLHTIWNAMALPWEWTPSGLDSTIKMILLRVGANTIGIYNECKPLWNKPNYFLNKYPRLFVCLFLDNQCVSYMNIFTVHFANEC